MATKNRFGAEIGDIVTLRGYVGTYRVRPIQTALVEGIYDFYAAPVGDESRGFHSVFVSIGEIVERKAEPDWVR